MRFLFFHFIMGCSLLCRGQGFQLRKLDLSNAPQYHTNGSSKDKEVPSTTNYFAQLIFHTDLRGDLWLNGKKYPIMPGTPKQVAVHQSFRYYFVTEDELFITDEISKKLMDHERERSLSIDLNLYNDYERLIRNTERMADVESFLLQVQNSFVSIDQEKEGWLGDQDILPEGFQVSKYEVTYGEFSKFRYFSEVSTSKSMGSYVLSPHSLNIRRKDPRANWECDALGENRRNSFHDHYPVINVTWTEAIEYCSWLTSMDPNYEYRLPYKEEWLFLARSHPDQPIEQIANTADASLMREFPRVKKYNTSVTDRFALDGPVGSYSPTEFGLYDLYGNVAEWLMDDEKVHTTRPGDRKQFIGGSYFVTAEECLSKKTHAWPTNEGHCGIGFRLCRIPK